jgi:predicted kinase
MNGFIVAGKTTVALRISQELRIPSLHTYDIRKTIDGPQDLFDNEHKNTVYRLMAQKASILLENNDFIVLDGTFHKMRWRRYIYDVSNDHDAKLLIVRCICSSESETIKRIISRVSSPYPSAEAKDIRLLQFMKNEDEPIERDYMVGTVSLNVVNYDSFNNQFGLSFIHDNDSAVISLIERIKNIVTRG